MKRRTIKKEICRLAKELAIPVRKYAIASPHVQRDVIYAYERELERSIFRLLQLHLILDRSWPHRTRWLDGLGEDFVWERWSSIIYGRGGLWYGQWPKVGESITRIPFSAEIRLCDRHGLEYRFKGGNTAGDFRFRSRKWSGAVY